MVTVLGRNGPAGPTGELGTYRARDGSDGAPVQIDLGGPHAALVVGKRGSGKSYTLGVLAEELADAPGVVPIVCDPMGTFSNFGQLGSTTGVVREPTIRAGMLSPRTWCAMLDLPPEGAVGGLLWHAAGATDSLEEMRTHIVNARADRATRRAAVNHLDLARTWGIFDPDGMTADSLLAGGSTVLDLSGLDRAAANAIVRGVADVLYRRCVAERPRELPWLLVDEAHVFFDGIAAPGLRTVLTRGRQPGISLVVATQRPSALPAVAHSQADILIAHRLTSRPDRAALTDARPSYMTETFAEQMPTSAGSALVVDDATESVHAVRIRERRTPHGGASATVSGAIQETG